MLTLRASDPMQPAPDRDRPDQTEIPPLPDSPIKNPADDVPSPDITDPARGVPGQTPRMP